jgi:ribosomal subunit interface protein
MDVQVAGRHTPVDAGLRSMSRHKLGRLDRIAGDVTRAEVSFHTERNPRIAGRHSCAVTLHVRGGSSVSARAAARSPETALDQVVDKLRHQLGRRKARRVSQSQSPYRVPRGRAAG